MMAPAERSTALTAMECRYHFEGSVLEKISKLMAGASAGVLAEVVFVGGFLLLNWLRV
jgi:hypothetical protein